MKNHIEEYLADKLGKETIIGREIFKADKDIDIKTELKAEEISLISAVMYNNDLLVSRGLKPVYSNFLRNYMRLKISLDRKSRAEFVNINKQSTTDDLLKGVSDLSNIKNVKK